MCGKLRMGLGTRNNRTGGDPTTRHFTERAALFEPIFPLHKLRCRRWPDKVLKHHDKGREKWGWHDCDYNMITVMGHNNTKEYYNLYMEGCFVLDCRYVLPTSAEARIYTEHLTHRDLTDWMQQHKLHCDILGIQGFYPRRCVIDNNLKPRVMTTLANTEQPFQALYKLYEHGGLFKLCGNVFGREKGHEGLLLPKSSSLPMLM